MYSRLFIFILFMTSTVVAAESRKDSGCEINIMDKDSQRSMILRGAAGILCNKWEAAFDKVVIEVLNLNNGLIPDYDMKNIAYETGELKNGRVWVRISESSSVQTRKAIIWFRLKGYSNVWTAKRDISEGSTLQRTDLIKDMKEISTLNLLNEVMLKQPEGMYTKKVLRRGQVISTDNVSEPPLIARNQNVNILLKSNGLQITTKATSLSWGWHVGDIITVVVNGTSEKIEATVADKGWAYVSN